MNPLKRDLQNLRLNPMSADMECHEERSDVMVCTGSFAAEGERYKFQMRVDAADENNAKMEMNIRRTP